MTFSPYLDNSCVAAQKRAALVWGGGGGGRKPYKQYSIDFGNDVHMDEGSDVQYVSKTCMRQQCRA